MFVCESATKLRNFTSRNVFWKRYIVCWKGVMGVRDGNGTFSAFGDREDLAGSPLCAASSLLFFLFPYSQYRPKLNFSFISWLCRATSNLCRLRFIHVSPLSSSTGASHHFHSAPLWLLTIFIIHFCQDKWWRCSGDDAWCVGLCGLLVFELVLSFAEVTIRSDVAASMTKAPAKKKLPLSMVILLLPLCLSSFRVLH